MDDTAGENLALEVIATFQDGEKQQRPRTRDVERARESHALQTCFHLLRGSGEAMCTEIVEGQGGEIDVQMDGLSGELRPCRDRRDTRLGGGKARGVSHSFQMCFGEKRLEAFWCIVDPGEAAMMWERSMPMKVHFPTAFDRFVRSNPCYKGSQKESWSSWGPCGRHFLKFVLPPWTVLILPTRDDLTLGAKVPGGWPSLG